MKKCRYCGKKLNIHIEFCCNECENNFRQLVEKDNRKIKYFILEIIVAFLVMLYGILSNSDFITGTGIILMGIVVVLLPFTTPDTIAFFGYRKSKFIGRILGMLLIVVGIWAGFS
ncbi:hypothetical protein [[Clostridium] hylemonae]|uniref:DUF2116 family Zn-ribbon domain-containing protein n=1 Tax=[Clostridium] hylemonae DSM 15053 TaxID=553973 RepID=C0BZ35_9FIRM|nr:hypothetical protein [[Clostridium] hylemonae]EEG75113.1 hypothetical protein CLOHYLEM_05074 [[Clostridium] hylemonae DSM 15053]QEK18454.1 hypothetical protein LAJLEIBI_02471 [[Clostridium] hylemonae DSM 15053]